MGFYAILNVVDQLLIRRQWRLLRCRRQADDTLHYYVTDAERRVLTPTTNRRRAGLTLMELLVWMEHCGDIDLVTSVHSIRDQVEDMW